MSTFNPPDNEAEYYRKVLDEGLHILCDATGRDINDYDRDQADGECYLDCIRDIAAVLTTVKYNSDSADYSDILWRERIKWITNLSVVIQITREINELLRGDES